MSTSQEESMENSEVSLQDIETEGLSQSEIVRKRFVRHRGAMVSIVFLIIIITTVYTALESRVFGIRIPGWWK